MTLRPPQENCLAPKGRPSKAQARAFGANSWPITTIPTGRNLCALARPQEAGDGYPIANDEKDHGRFYLVGGEAPFSATNRG